MPSKRPGRASKARRQPVRRSSRPAGVTRDADLAEVAVAGTAVAAGTAAASTSSGARPAARTSPSARTRSRAPAQIVIANYDFLRHDLRVLGILAPSLLAILVILSFVVS